MWCVTLAIFAAAIVMWITRRKKQFSVFKELGIPGPEPNILFGNMLEILAKSPSVCHREWIKKYGKVVGYYRGPMPIVLVAEPEMLKKIQVSDYHKFMNNPIIRIGIGFGQPKEFNSTLINLEDDRWKKTRSILTPCFSSSKLKTMRPIINSYTDILLQKVDEKAVVGESFDISKFYQALAMDVSGRSNLGIQPDCQNNPQDQLFISAKTIIASGSSDGLSFLLSCSFPELSAIWQMVDSIKLRLRNKGPNPFKMLSTQIKQVIQSRRKDKSKGMMDSLQVMIDADLSTRSTDVIAGEHMDERKEKKKGAMQTGTIYRNSENLIHMPDEEIISNSLFLLLSSYHTTSKTLTFITYFLARYPEVQKRLRKEINEIVMKEGKIEYSSLLHLQYLEQVLLETLRLYSPLPFAVMREVSTDVDFGNLKLKKGCNILVPLCVLHYHEDFWTDPELFRPERFAPENKGNINSMTYQPFGGGPRNCIGLNFGKMTIKIIIAKLLHNYKLVICDETDKLDMELKPETLDLILKKGVHVKAVRVTNDQT